MRTCSEDGCEDPHYGRGLCVKHYKSDHYRRNIERHKILTAAWVLANPGRKEAIAAAYYARDPEPAKARAAAYRAANPEASRAAVAAWVLANPERKRAGDAAYQAANMATITLRRAAYSKANLDKARAAAARRKARKLGCVVTKVDYAAILAEHGMVCHICSGEIESLNDLEMDHVIPLAKGGPHSPENLKPSHTFCNRSKGARLLVG
jgi:HNH endonuclease